MVCGGVCAHQYAVHLLAAHPQTQVSLVPFLWIVAVKRFLARGSNEGEGDGEGEFEGN